MIGPLKDLCGILERRRAENANFAKRLHPGRTVFLPELLADIRRKERIALLEAPWLDAGRFTARIAAACVFLDGVTRAEGVKGWDGMPLVFIQSGSVDEDALQHMEILRRDSSGHYAERFAHLPPAVHYLHTHPNFTSFMRGRWKRGTLVVSPHFGFAPERELRAHDRTFRTFHLKKLALGYRLTDYPSILGVGPTVATDYFARMVVHDLCHYFLPSTPFVVEGFHNVIALAAMGALPSIPHTDDWERFVHAECVDPTFCLRAGREIDHVRRALGVPSLVQEDFLAALAKWYVHPRAAEKRERHWNLSRAFAEGDASIRLRELIQGAQADGFRLYVRLMQNA